MMLVFQMIYVATIGPLYVEPFVRGFPNLLEATSPPYSSLGPIVAHRLFETLANPPFYLSRYYTLVAEIPATRLRDKTVRVAATTMIATMYVRPWLEAGIP